jgi:hypothetical protein
MKPEANTSTKKLKRPSNKEMKDRMKNISSRNAVPVNNMPSGKEARCIKH